jgi:hypothetical protein
MWAVGVSMSIVEQPDVPRTAKSLGDIMQRLEQRRLGKQARGACDPQDVLQLLPAQRNVEWHQHRAGPRGSQPQLQQLDPISAEGGNTVPGPRSRSLELTGDASRKHRRLRVAQGLPGGPDERAITERRLSLEDGGQGPGRERDS